MTNFYYFIFFFRLVVSLSTPFDESNLRYWTWKNGLRKADETIKERKFSILLKWNFSSIVQNVLIKRSIVIKRQGSDWSIMGEGFGREYFIVCLAYKRSRSAHWALFISKFVLNLLIPTYNCLSRCLSLNIQLLPLAESRTYYGRLLNIICESLLKVLQTLIVINYVIKLNIVP